MNGNVTFRPKVYEDAREIATRCLRDSCRRCMDVCVMMNDFGPNPGDIVSTLLTEGSLDPALAFSCDTCGNCLAVCPKDLPMRDLFLEARKDMTAANGGVSPFPEHRTVRFHQYFGFSKPFTTAVNGGGPKAFLAGCSLSSSSPMAVEETLRYLKTVYPDISAVQKCCGMPTQNMGQEALFEGRCTSLEQDLQTLGTKELIVACPNCKKILDRRGSVPTRSLWEVLPEIGIPEQQRGKGKDSDILFTIHDSCPARDNAPQMEGIRWLLREMGYRYVEAEASKEHTQCCGAGGMANYVNPEAATKVLQRRVESLPVENVVVYCGTCRGNLALGGAKAWHILDLLWGPVVTSDSAPPDNVLASTATAWRNRYQCKEALERALSE